MAEGLPRPSGTFDSAAAGRGYLVLASVTWVLLVFGASVRVHGAGLSCPDWPLCFGRVVPQLDFHVFLEWGHRALAGCISLGFLALGAWVLRDPGARRRTGPLVVLSAVILVTQIVLGGLTVLHLLATWSVTLHLLTGSAFFASLLVIARSLRAPAAAAPVPWLLRGLAVALTLAFVVQLGLGGLVASQWAGLACTEWPTCNAGVWFPTLDGIVGLQLAHRAGAYTLLAVAWGYAGAARGHVDVATPALRVAALVTLQALLGIANVLFAMPVELAIAHSGLASLLTAAVVFAVWPAFAARAVPVPA